MSSRATTEGYAVRETTVSKDSHGKIEGSRNDQPLEKTKQLGSLISTFYDKQTVVERGFSLFRIVEQKSTAVSLSDSWLKTITYSNASTNELKQVESSPPHSQDIEGRLYQSLMQARQQNFISNQILYLERLSDLYLDKDEYVKAAHLLNGALSLQLTQPGNPQSKKYLIGKLTVIEEKFLKARGLKGSTQLSTRIERHREFLEKLRIQCLKQFNDIEELTSGSKVVHSDNFRKIPATLTEGFKTLLKMLIEEAQPTLGKPPVEWACFGMGSMARSEMCPRSDIEFAFVLKDSTPEALRYFRLLSELLELQIINLGETKFPIFERVDKDQPSATSSGFSMDTGGNTPLGVKGVYELIGTPQQLSKFVGLEWIERNEILSNAMSVVCLVAGEQKLIDSYNIEKNKMLDIAEKSQTNREVLAFKLLSGHLEEFAPNLTLEKEQSKAFGIKKELYRPFQEILGCLALFYKLKESITFNRINELRSCGIFTEKGAMDLQNVLSDVLYLRIKAHFFYQDEKEFLCQSIEGEKRENKLLYISIYDQGRLEFIYSALFNFHTYANKFFHSRDKKEFNGKIVGELPSVLARKQQDLPTNISNTPGMTSYLMEGDMPPREDLMKLMDNIELQKANEFENYQKAVSLDPTNWISLMRLAKKEQELNKTTDALEHYLKAYKYVSPDVPHAAFICKQIGDIYDHSNKEPSALAYYEQALKIQKHLVSQHKDNPIVKSVTQSDIFHLVHDLVYIYFRMGNTQLFLKKSEEAANSFNEALKLIPSIKGSISFPVNPDTMDYLKITCTLKLGCAYRDLKDYPNAIKYIETAIVGYKNQGPRWIDKEIIAAATMHLAMVYQNQRQTREALKHYSDALKIDDSDKNKARINLALLNMYRSMEKYNDALKYAEKYLQLQQKIYGDNSVAVARVHTTIGSILRKLCKYQNAFKYHEKAVGIIQKNFDKKDVADLIYASIWVVFSFLDLGQPSAALDYFRKSLRPDATLMEQLDEDTIASLYDLTALLYAQLGKYEEAFYCYEASLKMHLRLAGKDHPDVANSFGDLANIALRMKQYKAGLDMQQKALDYNFKEYGESHSLVAYDYKNMGVAYDGLDDHKQALEYFQKALKILTLLFDENHPQVAECYDKMGRLYLHKKETKTALDFHNRALKIYSKIYGSHHPDVAECYENLGHVYSAQKASSKAREAYKNGFWIMYKIFKKEHPILIACVKGLINVETDLLLNMEKRYEYKNLKDLYSPCVEIFGQDHELTKTIEVFTQRMV